MIFDYLVVPRTRGEYTIPAVSLVYYDTASGAYKTIKTQPITVKVEKGNGNSLSVNDYSDIQNSDIRHIKSGEATYTDVENLYFGSLGYWLTIVLLIGGFVT